MRTRTEIEAAAQSETPTGKAIVAHFLATDNRPVDYNGLGNLASDGALAGAISRLLDDGLLERVIDTKRVITLVRLANYDTVAR